MAGSSRRKSLGEQSGVEAEVSSPTEANPTPTPSQEEAAEPTEFQVVEHNIPEEVLLDFNAEPFAFDEKMNSALAGETVSWTSDPMVTEETALPLTSDRVQDEPILPEDTDSTTDQKDS